MIQTVEAIIDPNGNVLLLEAIKLTTSRRAFVMILEEEPTTAIPEAALLAEPALAKDWNRPEEDAAWQHLQPASLS